jgi:hypothetical protein
MIPSPLQRLAQDRHALALLILLAAAFALVLRPSIHGNDGVQNYAYLRSLVFDGDLDFTNEYTFYISREASWFDGKQIPRDPVTGRPINLYGVGSSVLWAPWVIGFHIAGKLANACGAAFTLDGYSRLYEIAVGMASCFYASLGLMFVFRLLRREASSENVLWACIAVWLASPLFFYMYLHPSMSHANSFFLAALLLWVYEGGDSVRRWACMGAVAGLLVLTRFQDGVLLGAVAAGELVRRRESPGSDARIRAAFFARRYGVFAVAAAAVFSLQMLAWWALQGSPFSGPRAYMMQGSLRPWAPVHAIQVLFSSFHGLYFWHPVLLAATAGLFVGGFSHRFRLIALVGIAGQLWVVSSWSIWWAGASFGHRMFISVLPFLAVGAASLLCRTGKFRHAARVAVLLLSFWNFGYIVQYGANMIPRQSPVPIGTLVRNNVIEVPRHLVHLVFPR